MDGLTATVSLDDGWARVYLGERLDRDEFQRLAASLGLKWKRAEGCLAGPWSPQAEDTLRDEYGVTLEEENVDLRQVAERRAECYAQWAESAAERAEVAQAAERDILDNIPMGQPILVGHHSEAHHRRDLAKADRYIRRAIDEGERAEHWSDRAEATTRRAARRYTAGQLTARVGMLEIERRRHERRAAEYDRQLAEAGLFSPDARRLDADRARHLRYIDFIDRRIGYVRQLLDEAETAAAGDVAGSVAARLALTPEVGGGVSTDAPDRDAQYWYEVRRVNAKTITIGYWLGLKQLTFRLKREEIKQTMTAAAWFAAEKWASGPGLRIRPVPSAENEGQS